MKPANLGDYYRLQCAALERLAKGASPWQGEALELLGLAYRDTDSTDALLDILHRMQRLHKVVTSGLADNPFFLAAVQDVTLPLWGDFGSPPVPLDLQDSLAAKLYNCVAGDTALISLGDGAREIGNWLVEKCRASGVHFLIVFADPVFDALVINHANEAGVKALSDDFLKLTAPATKRIVARAGLPDGDPPAPDETKQRQFDRAIKPYSDRLRSGNLFYTLTSIPTRRDAEVDEIPYEDYIKLFFEMCDQPWDLIGTAQEKLIGEFNAAEDVRIANADGTDLRMNIKGFTFCNSLIAKNVPGSEIFSAPRRDSVEGMVVAKGRFAPPGTKRGIIENLSMEFRSGRLESFKADSGVELFANAVSIDEGARWIGELGIGTNPHLKKHVLNGLLVEKIGGSFHLALGACYSFKEYGGIPVNVDNGNQSALHWDVTTMLYGRQGKIWLDGRLVMDDGLWLDEAYNVLNHGWKSVPVDDRPEYWKSY